MNSRKATPPVEGSEEELGLATTSKKGVRYRVEHRSAEQVDRDILSKADIYVTVDGGALKAVSISTPDDDADVFVMDNPGEKYRLGDPRDPAPQLFATPVVRYRSRSRSPHEAIERLIEELGPRLRFAAEGRKVAMGVTERLRALAAQRLLLQLEEKRAVAAAAAAGRSQVEIARDLGVSQPTVHRLLRQIAADPDALERGPAEVAAEAAAGLVDRETMMAELAVLDPQAGESAPDGDADGYVLGAWDEVVDAWERGWLTDDEYEQLARL